MSLGVDIRTRLIAQNVCSAARMGIGAKWAIPAGPAASLSITEYGGGVPIRTQNRISPPSYQQPSAQILIRAESYTEALAMARAAYDALTLRNTTINTTFYLEIDPMQEPSDTLGLDAAGRQQIFFNVKSVLHL